MSIRPCIQILASIIAGSYLLTAGGCPWTPGGVAYSLDRSTYVSEAYEPKTVTLIDLRTMQPVRSWEIPVGKKLVIEFFADAQGGSPDAPDKLEWDIWPVADEHGTPRETMFVPPRSARRLDLKLRKAPELVTPESAYATLPGSPVFPVQQNLAPNPAGATTASATPSQTGPGPTPPPPIPGGNSPETATASLPGTAPTGEPKTSTPLPPPPQPIAALPTPAPSAPNSGPTGVANVPATPGQIVAGRYYLVAARLPAPDADKAVGALNASGIAARGLARDGSVWVVVVTPSYSEAEYAHPTGATNRDTLLSKVLVVGKAHKDAGGATNFTMASWELMK